MHVVASLLLIITGSAPKCRLQFEAFQDTNINGKLYGYIISKFVTEMLLVLSTTATEIFHTHIN